MGRLSSLETSQDGAATKIYFRQGRFLACVRVNLFPNTLPFSFAVDCQVLLLRVTTVRMLQHGQKTDAVGSHSSWSKQEATAEQHCQANRQCGE